MWAWRKFRKRALEEYKEKMWWKEHFLNFQEEVRLIELFLAAQRLHELNSLNQLLDDEESKSVDLTGAFGEIKSAFIYKLNFILEEPPFKNLVLQKTPGRNRHLIQFARRN